AGAEHVHTRERPELASVDTEERDSDQVTPLTHRGDLQARAATKMGPPRVEPLPREKRAVRHARTEQRGPVGAQRAGPPSGIDARHRDSGSLRPTKPKCFSRR